VPPEILFDQGFGDLFVVRVAGNVASDEVIGSIEFAVKKLGTKFIVVLGHEDCGAVTAAMGLTPETPGYIFPSILHLIYPVVPGRNLRDVTEQNALHTVKVLRESSPIIRDSSVGIKAAYYSIKEAKIEALN
jgi:carbonic anhydrase